MTRRPHHSYSNYILPTVLYWLVSWFGLWIEPTAVPARATIGIIPVLVMTNKMNSLAASLPPISQFTRLQSFMLMSLVVITMQMLEFAVAHMAGRVKMWMQNYLVAGADKKDDDAAGSGAGD